MSRESTSRPKHVPTRPGSRGSTLVGIFVGLILGALVAAGIALYFTSASPFQKQTKPDERAPAPAQPRPAPSGGEPIALPGKPGDKPVEKPRFDFYNVLPQGSDALPAPSKPEETTEIVKSKPSDKSADKPAGSDDGDRAARILRGESADKTKAGDAAAGDKPATPEKYYLQAGSFEDPSEADNLKARLALMGVEASVQKVDVPDKGTVHRVRVGPYLGQEDMTKAKTQLASAGINAAVVRVKPKEPKPAGAAQ